MLTTVKGMQYFLSASQIMIYVHVATLSMPWAWHCAKVSRSIQLVSSPLTMASKAKERRYPSLRLLPPRVKGFVLIAANTKTVCMDGGGQKGDGHNSKKITKEETYSSWDSHVVTHRSTNQPVNCLCMAERTGCPVLSCLWP